MPNPDSRQFDVTPSGVIADSLVVSPKRETDNGGPGRTIPGRGGGFVNDDEEDPIARVDVVPTHGEDIDAVVRRGETTMKWICWTRQTDVARQPFATISTGKDGIWAGAHPGARVGAGKLKLLGGNASVDLGAGAVIRILAPAEFELLRHDYLRLQNGTYLVDMPRSAHRSSL